MGTDSQGTLQKKEINSSVSRCLGKGEESEWDDFA